MSYKYHHMGVPTSERHPNERYHAKLKFSSTPFLNNPYRIQWHRFDHDCELPELIQDQPHVAFQVEDLESEIEDQEVILGPYEPIPGYRVAVIDYEGVCIEFVETDLTDEELADHEELSTE